MTKRVLSFVEAAMVLTVAWFVTGCGNSETEIETTESTTLLLETATESKAETEDVIEITAETETIGIAEAIQTHTFATYDTFLSEIGADYPGAALFTPTQILDGTWNLEEITYTISGADADYTYQMVTDSGDAVMLTVSVTEHYENAAEMELACDLSGYGTVCDGGANWNVYDAGEYGATLCGVTGDEHMRYTLTGEDSSGAALTVASLRQLRETLRL